MEPKKLYRNQNDTVIAGVCSGLAEYFDIDPVLSRIVFVLLALFGGGGVLVYVILWIILPKKPFGSFSPGAASENRSEPGMQDAGAEEVRFPGQEIASGTPRKGSIIAGVVLVTLGFLFLVDEFFHTWTLNVSGR